VLKALFSRVFSVGCSTHCDPSARFIVGVHTVRISNIELNTGSNRVRLYIYIYI
jgi:hypothetical protein